MNNEDVNASTMAPLLSVRDLRVEYGTEKNAFSALNGISFDVKPRETVALVGESGSGKSTTGLALMRLLPRRNVKATGAIDFDGTNLLGLDEKAMRKVRGRDISMIFQEPMTSLNPLYTIEDQIIEVIVRHKGCSRSEAASQALRMLELVEIPNASARRKDYPHQLSGGQRQRVMIAIALSCNPKLVIADEPTTALDVIVQAQILKLIKRLQSEYKTSIVFITHDLGIVSETADRVIVMQKGEIVEEGDVKSLFREQKHPYTQKLFQALPRIDLTRPPRAKVSSPVLVSVERLCKVYSQSGGLWEKRKLHHAVDDVSFELRRGEVLGLVGQSGSGKTTTGRSTLRLIEPTSGSVSFEGVELTKLPPHELRSIRQRMQIVFQDPYASHNPRHSVERIIAEPLVVHGRAHDSATVKRRVNELLGMVQLEPQFASRLPSELSGGQRQRVGIARALALEPSFIVADECVSALDVSIRKDVLELLKDLRAKLSLTMLFISHDLAVVEEIADRVAVMRNGKIVETADADQLFRVPVDPYTRELIAAIPKAQVCA